MCSHLKNTKKSAFFLRNNVSSSKTLRPDKRRSVFSPRHRLCKYTTTCISTRELIRQGSILKVLHFRQRFPIHVFRRKFQTSISDRFRVDGSGVSIEKYPFPNKNAVFTPTTTPVSFIWVCRDSIAQVNGRRYTNLPQISAQILVIDFDLCLKH